MSGTTILRFPLYSDEPAKPSLLRCCRHGGSRGRLDDALDPVAIGVSGS